MDRAPLGVSLPPVATPPVSWDRSRRRQPSLLRASSQHPEVARPCTPIWEGHPECWRHIPCLTPRARRTCSLRFSFPREGEGGCSLAWGRGAALPVRACPTSAKVLGPALSHMEKIARKTDEN